MNSSQGTAFSFDILWILVQLATIVGTKFTFDYLDEWLRCSLVKITRVDDDGKRQLEPERKLVKKVVLRPILIVEWSHCLNKKKQNRKSKPIFIIKWQRVVYYTLSNPVEHE